MRMRILGLILIATLAVAAAQTQGKEKKAGKPAAKPAAMPMMKQSPEMAKLQKLFAGTWKIEATVEPMPEMGMNEAATSKGTITIKPGPGGNSLIDDMKATGATGSITGHGVTWYDPVAGGYQAVWCDNTTPMGCGMNGVGKFEGDTLTFEGDVDMGPQAGGKMHMKETYSDVKPDSFTFNIESGPDAQHMKHMMTIKYTRIKGGAAATTKK